MSDPRWYVVQTQPHSERKACSHLIRQGFETYLPQYLKKRRHARKTEIVPAPLFPRYLFVLFDIATQPWRPIRSTIGVNHLVCQGDSPASVCHGVVQGLKGREDELGFIKLINPLRFARGDQVRVLDGVFSNWVGLFEGMTDEERVTVLLELLGRKVRVVMDLDSVAAA
jgi:transcriptional antiterminator RfaH